MHCKLDYLQLICYTVNLKEKPQAAYPIITLACYNVTAVTIASSGGLFFSLENLIAETDKGDNEYPELNEFL